MSALPDNFTFDFDSLADSMTLGDFEDVEELSGASLSDVVGGNMTIKGMRAMVFVSLRREHPDITFEDCRDIKLTDIATEETPQDAVGEDLPLESAE